MKGLAQLESVLNKGKQEVNTVRTLYLVMEKVGGYEQLMDLTFPALNEIIKCIEHFNREESKINKAKRR